MWVEFTQQYDHLFPNRAMRTYQPGKLNVPREVAEAAIRKGKAKHAKNPRLEEPADGEG